MGGDVHVSAPGKVLICGGYAVLKGGVSIALSTSLRFHVILKSTQPAMCSHVLESRKRIHDRTFGSSRRFSITVRSSYFEKMWQFYVELGFVPSDHQSKTLTRIVFRLVKDVPGVEGASDAYIEFSLFYSFVLVALSIDGIDLAHEAYQLDIELRADDGFYSKRGEFGGGRERSAKTGLGSSAALVCGLVGAVLSWAFGWTKEGGQEEDEHLRLIHNVSQLAHFQAQGKVGSGFDVSTAVYGSQEYYMLKREQVEEVMNAFARSLREWKRIETTDEGTDIEEPRYLPSSIKAFCEGVEASELLEAIRDKIGEEWRNGLSSRFWLPSGISVGLYDTGESTSTPEYVRRVFEWSEKDGANSRMFEYLKKNNNKIVSSFQRLKELEKADEEKYLNALRVYARGNEEKIDIHCNFDVLNKKNQERTKINLSALNFSASDQLGNQARTCLLDNCATESLKGAASIIQNKQDRPGDLIEPENHRAIDHSYRQKSMNCTKNSHDSSRCNSQNENLCPKSKSLCFAILNELSNLREYFATSRQLFRTLGRLSQTPLEPPDITEILDNLETKPGVIASGIAGAGGRDAPFILVIDEVVNEFKNVFWPFSKEGCTTGLLIHSP
ncbi:uncharacterized protein LOC126316913 [Schistocerca gregaria]|uniref:uncharacterized protein LOC126316913 n=1 Tax=Schistocerca gregaria TaxID=7010 RepID=UPI00211EFD78|nr:uncharacterized protein LOC126316913 [Schistocerca gregaria]